MKPPHCHVPGPLYNAAEADLARIFCIQLSSSKLAKIGIDPFAQTQNPPDPPVPQPRAPQTTKKKAPLPPPHARGAVRARPPGGWAMNENEGRSPGLATRGSGP